MIAVAAALGALALALAWPVPVALARAEWPSRSPATALVLWQGIALGGGLAMIGSLLAFAAAPGGSLLRAATDLLPAVFQGPIPAAYAVVQIAAFTLAVGLAVHLALNLVTTAVRAERARRRLHHLVDLLAEPADASGARVLSHPVPVAYCIPGIRTATVVTEGLVELLDEAELRSVLAHERAHLDQLHHLVLLSFRAWHAALPWFPIANRAERAVAVLTEMLADDAARRRAGADPLRHALERLGAVAEPGPYAEAGGVAPDGEMLAARLERLTQPVPPLPGTARAAGWAAAAALVSLPVGLLAAVAA
ncbi:M56 family metallopeptidase [Agromyces sp. GXS1127]|uniref:M56 family metallopeptidase n=1 Tax=Agromyces sp. GXS1127 TaxID=3424181 RepID=UPI003D31EA68